MTLEELARLIPLAPGHHLEAASLPAPGLRPGVVLTLTGPDLPLCAAFERPQTIEFFRYTEETAARHQRQAAARDMQDRERGYMPARPPFGQEMPVGVEPRPKFPGEDLDYTGGETRDRDAVRASLIHTGGPR